MNLPSMPMFWSDFFNATSLKMTGEQAAYYAILLGHAWINGGRIPDNDRMIANALRISPRKWSALKGPILAFWHKDDDGHWTQNRLNREYNFVTKKVETNRVNGMKGGRPTSTEKPNNINEKRKPTVTNGIPEGVGEEVGEGVGETKANLHLHSERVSSSSSKDARESETAEPPDPTESEDDDDEENKLILKVQGALGPATERHVAIAGLPTVRAWIKNGCDLELDVLPELFLIGKKSKDRGVGRLDLDWINAQVMARRKGRSMTPVVAPPTFFVKIETPQWEAWRAYRGKSLPTNSAGTGYYFPSEWPPGGGPIKPPFQPSAATRADPEVLH